MSEAATIDHRRTLLESRPRSAAELHEWVRIVLGFDVPRVVADASSGDCAPFDYLRHAFFEDGEGDAAAASSVRDCVVWANRGGGKTQLGAIATLLDMLFKPGVQVRILGGSFEQASRMHEHLRAMLGDEMLAGLVRGGITQRSIELRNGSRVEVLSQSERAVRGQRVQKVRCDEVELFDEAVWEAAQLTTRSMRCGDVEVRGSIEAFSTMHEPGGLMQRLVRQARMTGSRRVFRWGMMDALEPCGPERACEGCGLWDDCRGSAKKGLVRGFLRIDDMLAQRKRIGQAAWRAEMLCREPNRGNCVYPEFSPESHVFDDSDEAVARALAAADGSRETTPGGWWAGAIDFGRRDRVAVLLALVDDAAETVHVMDELMLRETTTDDAIEATKARLIERGWAWPTWLGADPADGRLSAQAGAAEIKRWKNAGFAVRSRSGLAIDLGVKLVRARLCRADGSVALRVHRRCAELIEAMAAHRYAADDATSSRPVRDGSEHACDALRHMVVNLDAPMMAEAVTRAY